MLRGPAGARASSGRRAVAAAPARAQGLDSAGAGHERLQDFPPGTSSMLYFVAASSPAPGRRARAPRACQLIDEVRPRRVASAAHDNDAVHGARKRAAPVSLRIVRRTVRPRYEEAFDAPPDGSLTRAAPPPAPAPGSGRRAPLLRSADDYRATGARALRLSTGDDDASARRSRCARVRSLRLLLFQWPQWAFCA